MFDKGTSVEFHWNHSIFWPHATWNLSSLNLVISKKKFLELLWWLWPNFPKKRKSFCVSYRPLFLLGLPSGENFLEKKLWFPYEVANNMKGCKLFNVLIFHLEQNLTKLFYGWWQLKLSICKTGQKNPSAAKDETIPTSTPPQFKQLASNGLEKTTT